MASVSHTIFDDNNSADRDREFEKKIGAIFLNCAAQILSDIGVLFRRVGNTEAREKHNITTIVRIDRESRNKNIVPEMLVLVFWLSV